MSRFVILLALSLLLCERCLGNSVIIIGAGPSGIAAATKLLENGITNITILEAEDRIGGRIHSVKFGDAYVDLGAQFCDGQQGNVVWELTKDYDLLKHNTVLDQPIRIYYSNGSKLNSELSREFQHLVVNFEETGWNNTGLSVGELFLQQFNSTLLEKYKNDSSTLSVLTDSLRLAESMVTSVEGSFGWFDSAADDHFQECEGEHSLTWNGLGYKTILEIMMKSYPDPTKKMNIDDKILLNKTVTKIDWSDTELVEVSTSDKSKYKADYVIFTPSIGVLKEQHERMFHPKLSDVKRKAIEQIGFHGIMKILLHFPTQWWKDDDEFFTFIWSEKSLKDLEARFGDNSTWISNIIILEREAGNPKVWTAWIHGKALKEMEVLPLETLKGGVVHTLKTFLGKDYKVVEPDEIIRSSWYNNPNFRGTYSFEQTKYFNKSVFNQDILAKPLENKDGRPMVFFAGEATNPIHCGSVRGAIETGYRDARKLMKLIGKSR